MDIDIETLLTLIFTIIFIALGALGNKSRRVKKIPELKTGEDESVQMEEESKEFFREAERLREGYYEQSERDVFSDEAFDYSIENDDLTKEGSILDKPISKIDNYHDAPDKVEGMQETSTDKTISSISDYIKMSEMGKRLDYKQNLALTRKIKKEFDPRKAILYMEIMRRKY